MAILTIDIGNTKTKVAIFENNLLMQFDVLEQINSDFIAKIKEKKYNISKAILSSVNKEEELHIKRILEDAEIEYYILTNKTKLPFFIDYKTPNTLGHDRIAAMVGAYSLKGKNNYLIIDIGTCITYDLIVNNHFVGGNISPGLQMRLDAMHQFTSSLPEIEIQRPENELGLTTKQAILNGAYWGTRNEIKSIISRYKDQYDNLYIIITGGGADYFDKEANIIYEPKLVSMGLNFLANNLSK